MTDDDLYRRGAQTLLACWEEHARGASGAVVQQLPGVTVAVFPDGPERAIYNNAVLERGLDAAGRGYTLSESTRAMGMALEDVRVPRPELDLGPPDWFEYLRLLEVDRDFLSGADRAAFHVLLARMDGENVATAMAYDADGDRGIFNVGTVERARRRGLGTALTAQLVHDALDRGAATATLQSTPMAERVYATVGFRDLGRILEFTPHA